MSKDEKASYYDEGGLETIDVIKAKLTNEQYIGYLLGNAIKYLCRCNFKENFERDIEKAKNYISFMQKPSDTMRCHKDYVMENGAAAFLKGKAYEYRLAAKDELEESGCAFVFKSEFGDGHFVSAMDMFEHFIDTNK